MRKTRTDRIGEEKINNQGLKMVIIAYRSIHDIDVKFEDGYVSRNKEYKIFKKGGIMNRHYPKPNSRRKPHKNINGIEHKYCSKCGEWKVLDEFGNDKRSWDKLKCKCRKCENTYRKVKPEDRKLSIVETREIDDILYKKCTECEEWKPCTNEYFKKEKRNKIIGLESKCKECVKKRERKYYKKNREKNRERLKKYRATPQGQISEFNHRIRTRLRKELQGDGITAEQWLEMMKYFNWECAYSDEYIGGHNKQNIRSIDHIVPLSKGGVHEIWNLVPMYKDYNSSKGNKDFLEWYKEQPFYSEDRLQKIYEWQEYAYNKWGDEDKII